MVPSKQSNEKITFVYNLASCLAALTFAIAMLTTVPFFEEDVILPLYKLMLKAAAAAFIVAEITELAIEPVPRCSIPLCFLTVLGNCLYIWCTYLYDQFNKGQVYLFAQFCISFAYEIKILIIIINENKSLSQLMRMQKKNFFRCGCLAIGTIFFLAGTIILLFEPNIHANQWSGGLMNSLAGITFIASVIILFRPDAHRGYEKFDFSKSIPRIV